MNRNGGVIALTVVGVLVAGGAAAALNTVVLRQRDPGLGRLGRAVPQRPDGSPARARSRAPAQPRPPRS